MTKTTSYTVTSATGEDNFLNIPVDKALVDIIDLTTNQSKWLFINGAQKDSASLIKNDLLGDKIIVLTDMLIGG